MVPIFYFDDENYYAYEGIAQVVDGETLLPPQSTTVEPPKDFSNFFHKWNGEKWISEAKPKNVEDFVGLRISHTSQTDRCIELRALLQSAVDNSDGWRVVRGDESEGLWWGVEKIPEPTEKEKKEARISELKGKLSATDYVVAKIAEGVATKDDYAQTLEDRKSWRAEINQLEAEIAAIKG